MIIKMTGPTERDKNNPSPNPAMNDVNMRIDKIDPKNPGPQSGRKLSKFYLEIKGPV
jgi:hypothetical protein